MTELDELEELSNQQWWAQLNEDEMAIEEFLLLVEETRWQKFIRKLKEELRRWV